MKPSWTFTRGLLLGAGLMYFMDPSQGGRRRARARDHGVRAWRRSSRYAAATRPDRSSVESVPSALGFLHGVPRALQLFTAAMGAVAVAYGARKAIDRAQVDEDEGRIAPNYAYLR